MTKVFIYKYWILVLYYIPPIVFIYLFIGLWNTVGYFSLYVGMLFLCMLLVLYPFYPMSLFINDEE